VITRDDIQRAYDTIRPYLRRTPVMELDLAGPVTLKLEQLQCAGSFKARGAFTNLLLRDVPPAGVAAASGGNHGVAVAYAAHRLGIPARPRSPLSLTTRQGRLTLCLSRSAAAA
jgi:threonine dehydratase